MKRYRHTLDNPEAASSKFDALIECLIVGLLVFMPLAFGVVHAWSEEVVIVLSGAVVICFLLKLVTNRGQGIIWTWAYVPLGLFLLIPILQLVPLPGALVKIISPNTAVLKTELLGDLPNAETVLKTMSLSFYPHATKHDLRLVLAVAAIFVVVFNVFRRPAQIKKLLTVIAAIGGIIAVIALAQNLFGNGKIFWVVSTNHGKGYSGPFVNHSNYGQFMNLSIGGALALLMVKLREAFADRSKRAPEIFEYLSSGSAKPLWLLIGVMGLGAAAVFVSLTRGGMVSMLIAISFTTLLAASRRSFRSHGWIMVVAALIAFVCVLYIGFDAVYERLASIRDFDKAEAGRLQILKDIWIAWTKFPILGTGLGTHSVVYPMFDRSTITALAAHAENEYAQAAEETGLLGLSLLMFFGIIVWSCYAKSIRSAGPAVRSAAYGLGFGILAILIHSLSDFGQHLPANAVLSAIFCALLLTLARQRENSRQEHKSARAQGLRLLLTCALLACAIVVWIWALAEADNARAGEAHWKKALAIEKGLVKSNWNGTDAEYARLISHTRSAAAYEPENIKYRHWLNVYRWRSLSQITDADTGETIIPEYLMPTVHDIVSEFHKARIVCPTYGPTYSMVGQIEKFILYDESGAERIRKGFRLSPCDPIACFVAGRLDVSQGRDEDCVEKFEKAVQLDRRLFEDVANIYVNHLSRPHLAMSAAGDDIGRLKRVASIFEDMQYNDLREQAREKIKDLLEAQCSRPDAPASAFVSLGDIYRRKQDTEAAIECYRRALALDYGQVHWRLEFARLLAEARRFPEAMRQAKICLQLRPQLKAAKKLVADFSVNPAVFGDEMKLP